MTRVADWPELLPKYIDERRYMSFEWGRQDCALFLADWIVVATGIDRAKKLRRYKTAKGAAAVVKRHGGMKELAIVTGLPERHPGLAQRGDGVLVAIDGRESFGIVAGNAMWCGPGQDGLVFRPMSTDVIAAFEV